MNKKLPSDQFIRGRCVTMCPEKEILMRERNALLHPLEMHQIPKREIGGRRRNTAACRPRADRKRVIKSYSRPAAGQGPPDPDDIRTSGALYETVRYLITEVVPSKSMPWNEIYDFVFDRLRAVRQDLVMQGSPSVASVEILEPITRFLAYAGYRLCEDPVSRFNPIINRTHFLECIKRLLVLYERGAEGEEAFPGRPDMEAMYLLLAPGSEEVLQRAVTLPLKCRSNVVDYAFEFSLCCYLGNYVRAVRQLAKLPVLHACVAALHLPHVRRQALRMMSVAYSSRNLRYPSAALASLLAMGDEAVLVEECRHYGLDVDIGTGVVFSKSSFNCQVEVRRPVRVDVVDKKLATTDIMELLLGNPVVN